MKVIKCEKGIYESINFVDINNVFVGYHEGYYSDSYFDYRFVSSNFQEREIEGYKIKIGEELNLSEKELDKYVFYLDENIPVSIFDHEHVYTGFKLFRLFRLYDSDNSNDIIYLLLYNVRNGYYSHGFNFTKDDVLITEERER